MKRSNRSQRFEAQRGTIQVREALERRWADRMVAEPRLATLVTAQGNAREPFHRWLPYRQGFSPGLVRHFLREPGLKSKGSMILDPFSGSGTTITECACNRQQAVGVEDLASLVFLNNAKFEPSWTELPCFDNSQTLEAIADDLVEPLHRAALMIAQARRHTGSGSINRGAPPIAHVLRQVGQMIGEDMTRPLPIKNQAMQGDAREMEGITDQSVDALITSPPYLSRYDYVRTNDPIETLYRHWFPDSRTSSKSSQVRASAGRGSAQAPPMSGRHEAIDEVCRELIAAGLGRQARTVTEYFEDMGRVLEGADRVLTAGAPAWFILGGVRLKDAYVPTDLIFAEMAESQGFEVEGVRAARELNPIRRKFGSAGYIAPRESLIMLRKS